MTMFCKINVFSGYFVFSFVWLIVISSLSSSLFSSIYFSSVIEFFFRCYFRITRRFMLRSQHGSRAIITLHQDLVTLPALMRRAFY